MAIHTEASPLAGKTVRIKSGVKHPQVENFGGSEYRVEDWWDRVAGKPWGVCDGNPACLIYAVRIASAEPQIWPNNEVLYGKDGVFGHLVHISEIEMPKSEGEK